MSVLAAPVPPHATAAHDRGIFAGRCYVCGSHCGHTYCNEHLWAADDLCVPYRPCQRHPNGAQLDTLAVALETAEKLIRQQERKLDAWRQLHTPTNTNGPVDAHSEGARDHGAEEAT